MANQEQLAILKQGAKVWYKWRKEHRGEIIDLQEADLRWANLEGAYLSDVDLRQADLSGANLRRIWFTGADLRGTRMAGADLSGAHLYRTRLEGADLLGVDLRGAALGAYFDGANLEGARGSTKRLINQALSLRGAILPDGTLRP